MPAWSVGWWIHPVGGPVSFPGPVAVIGDLSATGSFTADTDITTPTINGVAGALAIADKMSMAAGKQLLIDPGTVSAPGLGVVGDTGIGMYRVGAGNWGMAAGGVKTISASSGSGAMNGNFTCSSVYIPETAAPSAVANYCIIYGVDVATKTALNAKQGAAGTVTQLAIEV